MKLPGWLTIVVFLACASNALAATVTLEWNPSTDSELAGYVVSYGTQSGIYTSNVDSGRNTSQQLTDLVGDTRYYFVVKVYSTAGVFSPACEEISAVVSDTPSESRPDMGRSSSGSTPAPVSSSTASIAAVALRLMTWNINGGHDWAGAPNVDAQVALMVESGAQVIALQGVTISAAADLSTLYQWKLTAATGRSWNVLWIPAPEQLAPARPEGNLLLTPLPIASSAITTFDSAPFDPTLRDAKRAAGWIGVVVNQVTVSIGTTQLAADATQRAAQLTQFDGWAASIPAPRLIGGDFHLQLGDATYDHLANGFRDAWRAVGPQDAPGLTQVLSPSQFGRFDYWWSGVTDQRAVPTSIWVVETSHSNHHALVIDATVQ